MKGIIGRHIDKGSSETAMHRPQTVTGGFRATAEVVHTDFENNPWLQSLHARNLSIATSLTIKNGMSFEGKVPGAGKQHKIWLNPEVADSQLYGDSTGKKSLLTRPDGESGKMQKITASFIGGNNQIPTIMGIKEQDRSASVVDRADQSLWNFKRPDFDLESGATYNGSKDTGKSALGTPIVTGVDHVTDETIESFSYGAGSIAGASVLGWKR